MLTKVQSRYHFKKRVVSSRDLLTSIQLITPIPNLKATVPRSIPSQNLFSIPKLKFWNRRHFSSEPNISKNNIIQPPKAGRFRLSDQFLSEYKDTVPPFGFNSLGEIVYRRTYSRLKEDGEKEQWYIIINFDYK
jgi:hypothetical protein